MKGLWRERKLLDFNSEDADDVLRIQKLCRGVI